MADNDSRSVTAGTGEHQNGRHAMDDLTRRMVSEGVDPKKAAERARQTALRMDRKNNGRSS
jgi:hypothetical protein